MDSAPSFAIHHGVKIKDKIQSPLYLKKPLHVAKGLCQFVKSVLVPVNTKKDRPEGLSSKKLLDNTSNDRHDEDVLHEVVPR